MKRIFDIFFAFLFLVLFFVPFLMIGILVKLTSEGPVLYWSDRVGYDNKIFKMAKFRTMKINTPVVATHLLCDPDSYLTVIGRFLRRTSLDELPQLLNVLAGNMSFVGPRPALFNQYDLIELRTNKNIHKLFPGITGWAQINGRDKLPVSEKVIYDEYYMKNYSFFLDLRILFKTFIKVINKEGIKH